MAIDFDVIFGGDPFDPCAARQALFPAYMKARLAPGPQKIMFRDREVWFHKQDLDQCAEVMRDLERQCRAKCGQPSGRFAISAGYRYPR